MKHDVCASERGMCGRRGGCSTASLVLCMISGVGGDRSGGDLVRIYRDTKERGSSDG